MNLRQTIKSLPGSDRLRQSFSDIPFVMSEAESSCYATLLGQSKTVVEYGAGGSTLFAVKSGMTKIVSIEADVEWLSRLRRNWRIRLAVLLARLELIHVNIGPVADWSYPASESRRDVWPDYARAPWKRMSSADLVLVDGRFRIACIAQTVLKAPRAVIVVHDFWNRPEYHEALQVIDEVRRVDTMGIFKTKADAHHRAIKLFKTFCFDPR